MSAHDEAAAIRAGAQAIYPHDDWDRLHSSVQAIWEERFVLGRNAYLRHLRAAGYVVTRVPEAEVGDDDLSAYMQGKEVGWNAARAEMLANAIDGDNT